MTEVLLLLTLAMPPPLVQSSDLPAGIGRSVALNAPGSLYSPDAIRAVVLRAEALSALQGGVSLEPSDRRHSAGFERVLPVLHAVNSTPMTDAVGTMGRYVPEPVGMAGNWQPSRNAPQADADKRGATSGNQPVPDTIPSAVNQQPAAPAQNMEHGEREKEQGQLNSRRWFHAPEHTPQVKDDADDRTSRVDLGLGVISLSAAMIATGLTSSCLAAKTCHETVPITRAMFDHGPVWGVIGRAAVSGLIHYGVARWIPKGRWRTATLGVLAAINVTNAVLDIRTLTKIEQDAGR